MPPQSHGTTSSGDFYVSKVSLHSRFGSSSKLQPGKPLPPTNNTPNPTNHLPHNPFRHSFICHAPAVAPTTTPLPTTIHRNSRNPNPIPSEPAIRRPKLGCSITHNELCPNVRAKDRIHAWSSPYANAKRSERSLTLPPEVIEWGEKLTIAGLADSTKEAYGAGLLRFNQFCDMLDISEDQRMPTSEHLIIGFLGYHIGKVSGSCAKNWLSALRAWHELKGAPWPADSRLIRFARAGARVSGAHNKRPIRNPISINHMLALFLALKFSIPFHCSIWAVACNAFWGCRRLGELTVKSIAAFNPTYHASRSTHILFSFHPDNSPKAVSFHVPWTKTTKQVGATVTATAQTAALKLFCPFNAMQMHVRANSRIPDNFSLFAYVDDHGQPHHMVKSAFLTFCDKIWLLYPCYHHRSFPTLAADFRSIADRSICDTCCRFPIDRHRSIDILI